MKSALQNFFYPRNIAVIGASSKKGSIGYELTASIIRYGFKGSLYLINPTAGSILGHQCYPSITDTQTKVDLAVILVPKQFAKETIQSALDYGIKSFILITAGFRETGGEGEKVEKEIVKMISDNGARLIGPNCMGVINTLDSTKLNATFVAEHPETGQSAFLSQSGALGAAVLNSLRETGIRFAHFISVGNKADVTENELIEFWETDPNIKITALYLESFGDGRKFLNLFSEQKIKKPVVLLKAGKTSAGIRAASSHTGALGSSDKVVNAIVKQFRLLRVSNLNDLFNTVKGFQYFPLPEGKRVAVITNAGGPAILAVDQIEQNGLMLADFSESTKTALRQIVHPEGSINNPVDLLPGGTAENYRNVVEVILQDKNVDSVVVIFVEPVMVKPEDVVNNLNSISSKKPVFIVAMPLPEFWNKYRSEHSEGKPVFRNPEDPSVIISNMYKYGSYNRNQRRLCPNQATKKLDLSQEGFLPPEQVSRLMQVYRIPLVETKILSFNEVSEISDGFPYVLKAGGEQIIHKSDLNGIELNLHTRADLISAAVRLRDRFEGKQAALEYYIMQPQISPKHEVLIGGFRDPDFGPMVMFGTGGKYVEFYEDIAIKSAYLSGDDIDDMLAATVMGRILRGVRGDTGVNISEIKETISSLAQLMLDYEQISEVDFNPLIVDTNNKLFSVDIRIKVKT